MRAAMRRQVAPSADWLFSERGGGQPKGVRPAWLPDPWLPKDRPVRADRTLPPEILVPGQSSSHEVRFSTVLNRDRSGPISETTFKAVEASMPALHVTQLGQAAAVSFASDDGRDDPLACLADHVRDDVGKLNIYPKFGS